ncbi:MAG: thiamine-phosphate kinase, partial [Sciscionella sp.]
PEALAHIAGASGVSIDVRTDRLDVAQRLTEVASALGADALDWVLTGGDDHALVATFEDAAAVPPGWRVIGSVGKGHGVTVDGAPHQGASGWSHFG